MPRYVAFLRLLVGSAVALSCGNPDGFTAPFRPAFDHDPSHIVVNSLADPGADLVCDAAECTLREALRTVPDGGRITFSVAGLITLARHLGSLRLERAVTIEGPASPRLVVISGRLLPLRSAVVEVTAGTRAHLSRLRFQEGHGGVRNRGDLTLVEIVSTLNTAEGLGFALGFGAGIHNEGTLRLERSSVSFNTTDVGAGIGNAAGSRMEIVNSTISRNRAIDGAGLLNRGQMVLTGSTVVGNIAPVGVGGGLWNTNNLSTLRVANSTFSGNRAAVGGGIGISGGQVKLQNTTLAANEASGGSGGGGVEIGAGLSTFVGSLHLDNTLVASNVVAVGSVGPDLLHTAGSITAHYSVIQSPEGHPFTDGVDGNLVGVTGLALNLGPLASNGGPTQTHALRAGSVAIDAGRIGTCQPTDQRGVLRPVGGGCDVGSYEFSIPHFSVLAFLAPIQHPPTINNAIAGEIVKLSFGLKGGQGGPILAPGSPLSQTIACQSRIPTASATLTSSQEGLQYDPVADVYTYPWQTSKEWTGSCQQFILRLSDGTAYRADFAFAQSQ